jgi:catechol 2,3-dioxygenase-like lactoylglutathione lyase family enzyme
MPSKFDPRGLALFVAGIGCGILLMQSGVAQTADGTKLNHVGIAVKNFDAAVQYYTQTLGFRQAFAIRDPEGKPILTYLQISRETFLEIQPATAERPVGITHFGLENGDVKAMAARIRQSGIKVDEPAATGRSGAVLTNAIDAEGVRAELLQFGPESLQRKAMNAWK